MEGRFSGSVISAGRDNNYYIGGNYCNAFALGQPGSEDDFFLIGAEPEAESNYPLLSGTILDSEGNVMCRLARNVLSFNPGACSKIYGDGIGYEIHDNHGQVIFRVQSKFEWPENMTENCLVTRVAGNFYDKTGKLVVKATDEPGDERVESNVKTAFGFVNGDFVIAHGMTREDANLARLIVGTNGKINRIITGQVTGEEISLDGAALVNANLSKCTIKVSSGHYMYFGHTSMTQCELVVSGAASALGDLIEAVKTNTPLRRTGPNL